ncbi:SprB repeat-containing protein, partial [Robertkochia solimangrovi]|uniref:SprB repeat-containing protein n=1 Tax=Robertkochia solimangrovi TaxID=2213046 RepID=UPI0018EF714E
TSPETVPVSGLSVGNYYVTIEATDYPYCPATTSVISITGPDAAVSLVEIENINANCNEGAQVTVKASGGRPGYTYAYVASGASAPATGDYSAASTFTLTAASYPAQFDIYVLDSSGSCGDMITVEVDMDIAPTVTIEPVADQCTSNGTAYTVVANGTGIAPLSYSIGGSFQSSNTFTVSAPGTYTVTVRDANGCIATDDVTIYPPLTVALEVVAQPSCSDDDGSITATGAGGTDSFEYSIDGGTTYVATNTFPGLSSGPHTVWVRDTNTGCTASATITLEEPAPVVFELDAANVSCNGGLDGSITVVMDASNTNPPYTYTLEDGVNAPVVQTSPIFTGLAAGAYTITVTSDRECTDVKTQTILEPDPVSASVEATEFACDASNGVNQSTITVTASGGTAPYMYSIDGTNYQESNIFMVSDTGVAQSINIDVRDANGCFGAASVTIEPLPVITNVAITQLTA